MFDTMTLTKIVSAFCASLLVLLLGGWVAESLYHTGGGHGDGHQQAYVIDTGEDETEVVEDVPEVPFAEVYAIASASDGEKLWRPCAACHKLEEGANGVGPYLYGVVGRDKGSVDGFSYSSTLAEMEGDWTPENLSGFLEDPKGYAPGTKMVYRGLKDVEDRANLIAYLDSIGD
ncbi:c-type cytochrome [Oceaniglobus ichthyenteri]|uniref:c-type cytochrome n=1 Tax=Oceaniglobus ichthyenteri TaxID=2136177 RepID=UPI000D3C1141|nr:cytochrome c family protein [Oceaniglobus ichthyenteri]